MTKQHIPNRVSALRRANKHVVSPYHTSVVRLLLYCHQLYHHVAGSQFSQALFGADLCHCLIVQLGHNMLTFTFTNLYKSLHGTLTDFVLLTFLFVVTILAIPALLLMLMVHIVSAGC